MKTETVIVMKTEKQSKTDKTKNKFKKLLSKRGETIMETLVSLLIMGILITSLLSIIRFSLVLTGDSLSNALESQGNFNTLFHGSNYDATSTKLDFTIVTPAGVGNGQASQAINLSIIPATPNPAIPNITAAFRPVP